MKKYIIYNTLLNVGIILLIISAVSAYNSDKTDFLIGSVFLAAVLFFIKYKLLRHVRHMTDDNKK